jgi:hypothetical protein
LSVKQVGLVFAAYVAVVVVLSTAYVVDLSETHARSNEYTYIFEAAVLKPRKADVLYDENNGFGD